VGFLKQVPLLMRVQQIDVARFEALAAVVFLVDAGHEHRAARHGVLVQVEHHVAVVVGHALRVGHPVAVEAVKIRQHLIISLPPDDRLEGVATPRLDRKRRLARIDRDDGTGDGQCLIKTVQGHEYPSSP
jgi:hypothetical protein